MKSKLLAILMFAASMSACTEKEVRTETQVETTVPTVPETKTETYTTQDANGNRRTVTQTSKTVQQPVVRKTTTTYSKQ